MSLTNQFIFQTSAPTSKKQVNYLSRDFQAIRTDLINYIKLFYPDQWQDFNIASAGMAMVDINAYVGDLLSYTVDKKYNELFIDGIQKRSEAYRMAKTMGYKVPGTRPSITVVDITIEVPVTANGPNPLYLPIFRAGAKIKGAGQVFENLYDIDFSNDFSEEGVPNRIIEPVKNNTENIIKYKVKKREKVVAGTTRIAKIDIPSSSVKAFYQYTLPETNVLDVVAITIIPSLGLTSVPTYAEFEDFSTKYWEVGYLADSKIFVDDSNILSQNGLRYGKYMEVTKRFTKEFMSDGRCKITFGGGELNHKAYDSYVSSLTSTRNCSTLPTINVTDTLNNTALGEIVPANSTLFIKYRVGGGPLSNVGSNVLNSISDIVPVISGPDPKLNELVVSSARVNNTIPAMGGLGLPGVEEIKHYISANFASQERCVTLEDYIARAYQLPGKYGAPFRIYGEVEDNKVKLYIIAIDGAGKLITVSTNIIKNNLAAYLTAYRMINDYVEINDGKVINLQIEVDLYTDKSYNSSEVKLNAINAIKTYFQIEKWQMNQTIYISDMYDIIREVPGVINVVDVRFFNMEGGRYSYTTHQQADNDRTYDPSTLEYRTQFSYIDNSIIGVPISMFEFKYPERDIMVRLA